MTEAGTDEQPGKPAVNRPSWKIRAITALAVLQAYNIVSNHQTLLDLSRSVRLLSGWWHYFVARCFAYFHVHIPQVERELIVLFLLLIAAANATYFRVHGKLAYGALLSEDWYRAMNEARFAAAMRNDALLRTGCVWTIMAGATVFLVSYFTFRVSPVLLLYFLTSLVVRLFLRSAPHEWRSHLSHRIFELATRAPAALLATAAVAATYSFEFVRLFRYLFLLLLLDLLVRVLIEPAAPWISELPLAPPAP